jgi:DNA-directed RNA polymerase specialized sigma24 family protein
MTHVADFVLIDAARTGDRSALAGLVGRHQDAVYRFGRLMCGSVEDAKDVVQDTMMKVLEKVGDFRGESSFRTWLYAIAQSVLATPSTRQAGTGRCIDGCHDPRGSRSSALCC